MLVIHTNASLDSKIGSGLRGPEPSEPSSSPLLHSLFFPEVLPSQQDSTYPDSLDLEMYAEGEERLLSVPGEVSVASSNWETIQIASDKRPLTRSSHSAALWHADDGSTRMLVSFGFHSSSPRSIDPQTDCWSFNFMTSEWTRLYTEVDKVFGPGDVSFSRGGHLTVVRNNKLYLYGGLEFNPTTRLWTNAESDGTSKMWMLTLTDPNPTWLLISSTNNLLTRGEVAGGIWRDNLVFFGGLHISSTHLVTLADTHFFNLDAHVFKSLDELNRGNKGPKPKDRFSHAAAVVGDELVIFGGRGLTVNQRNEQDAYMLDDVWSLDLVKEEWTELKMRVPISRCYQSLVGESRFNSFWSFGGYKEVQTRGGREFAFVFNDLMRGSIGSDHWDEFKPKNKSTTSVKVRYRHSAVYWDSTIFIYGGTYEYTDQVQMMVAVNTSLVKSSDLVNAADDDLGVDDFFGVSPLHLAVGVMLVMVLVFISMFTILRRRVVAEQGQSAGLNESLIDSIPILKYGVDHRCTVAGNSQGEDCCSICLCEYEEGEDVRFLPCKHIFHPGCVDTWLKRNASCPACRQNIS
eukprot:CAMPEP_0118649568 /NCGR_PEP_ID=MMETSP0785-20121206/9773_1 /TAXON_ID=91992 /ORGANISM="Bolidomonas pacifica, Strain CCMP 1866" /LENGTH=573 /DNA_ID=CAMNT_0006541865 /DNA_START=189 /DNA_END=1907 /DNA_ORIENTATION=-